MPASAAVPPQVVVGLTEPREVFILATFAGHRRLCDEAGEAAEVIVLELEDLFAVVASVGVELAEPVEVLVALAALNGATLRAGGHDALDLARAEARARRPK
jgi:hypothetical protein